MSLHSVILIGAYILIGIFVASAVGHFDDNGDSFDLFMLVMLFWPIVIAVLVMALVLAVPFLLGKWAGRLLHDLLR